MITALLKNRIRGFERHYGYDAGYLADTVDADARGGLKLMLASTFLAHRFAAPTEAYFAAKVRSAMRADCGPCLELTVKMAEEAGIVPADLLPVLGHGDARGDIALAIRFADAVIDNAEELVEIVDETRRRFGERAMPGLAAAVVAGQFYPLYKRGMGHAATCRPVVRDLIARHGGTNGMRVDVDHRIAAGLS